MICPHCNKRNYPGIDSCSNCKLDLSSFDVPVAHDRVERSLMEDPVGVVKPPPAVILHASTPVSQALDIMIDQNIGALLVVDDQNKMTNSNMSWESIDLQFHFFLIYFLIELYYFE